MALSALSALPPDPLLNLMAQFRADTRPEKVDLGVGVYKDADGKTPIMSAVFAAEHRLHASSDTKVYEGPRGNAEFGAAVERLVYGETGGREAFATPGGCGALGLAMGLVRVQKETASVWMSAPSWPNHPHVATAAGLAVRDYPFLREGRADVETALAALKDAEPGDALLLQGPCHNPTGADFDLDAWDALAAFAAERGLLPVVDIAYHGLGDGLDADIAGVRRFLAGVPDALVTYSCSKNFGLYRDRSGCLLVQGETPAAVDAAATHAASIARATYSMPPAHGAAIVATILGDDELGADWRRELDEMRARIAGLRAAFADALARHGAEHAGAALAGQKGMFSVLPLPPGGAEVLRAERAIFLHASGRINVAGLPETRIDAVAEAIARAITS